MVSIAVSFLAIEVSFSSEAILENGMIMAKYRLLQGVTWHMEYGKCKFIYVPIFHAATHYASLKPTCINYLTPSRIK